MAATTVRDVLGDIPAMHFEWNPREVPDPNKIWADYDAETDSLSSIQLANRNGEPKFG